jgi:dTDP-4-amino-4,6-dideoxygalactose transaminase
LVSQAAITIPTAELHRESDEIGTEVRIALERVLERGWYLMGPEVAAFEAEFAEWLGIPQAVAVGSGTDALTLALAGLGIGPGDEVITSAMTSVATATAIILAGAEPILADIDSATMNIDPQAALAAVGERTRALMPVHLYGRSAPMAELLDVARSLGLYLVEDACQAHGAEAMGRRVGTLGDAGCFSFYPTKNLGAYGDGGMVVTADDELAERVRLLRQYGWRERDRSETRGWNSRLDEMQSAVLRVKLPRLDAWNRRRREIALRYSRGLAGVPGLILPEDLPGHAHHLYVVRVRDRNRVRAGLATRRIKTGVHYPLPVHRHPGLSMRYRGSRFPGAEAMAETVLSLPIFPHLADHEVDTVIVGLRAELGA